MTVVDLEALSRHLFEAVVARALGGDLVPGVSWVAEEGHDLDGTARVHFAVDGDLTGSLGLLGLPAEVEAEVHRQARITVQGRVSLSLDPLALDRLRATVGAGPTGAGRELLAAYHQGLRMTFEALHELERRGRALARQAVEDLGVDLEAAGYGPEAVAGLAALFAKQAEAFADRMAVRRVRLDELGAELAHFAASGSGDEQIPATLERILGEEYSVTSEAQAELAAFEGIVQRALSEAAVRFGTS